MAIRTPIVERAFELARSGSCETIEQIERALSSEQYDEVTPHLSAPLLRSQLRGEMATGPRPQAN